MLTLIGEGHNLGLNTGAIARANALYLSVEKGRFGQSLTQNSVAFIVSKAGPAGELFQRTLWRIHKRELMEILFAILNLHLFIVHAATINTYRSAGLHTSIRDAVSCDGFSQFIRCRFCHASTGQHGAPHMHQSVKEGACSQHNALGSEFHAPYRLYAADFALFNEQTAHRILPDMEVRDIL